MSGETNGIGSSGKNSLSWNTFFKLTGLIAGTVSLLLGGLIGINERAMNRMEEHDKAAAVREAAQLKVMIDTKDLMHDDHHAILMELQRQRLMRGERPADRNLNPFHPLDVDEPSRSKKGPPER